MLDCQDGRKRKVTQGVWQATAASQKIITLWWKPSRRLPWPKVLCVLYLWDNNSDSFFFFLPPFARTFPKPGAGTPLLQHHGAGGTRRPAWLSSAVCHQPQYSVLTWWRPFRGFVAFLSHLCSGLALPPWQGEALQRAGGHWHHTRPGSATLPLSHHALHGAGPESQKVFWTWHQHLWLGRALTCLSCFLILPYSSPPSKHSLYMETEATLHPRLLVLTSSSFLYGPNGLLAGPQPSHTLSYIKSYNPSILALPPKQYVWGSY